MVDDAPGAQITQEVADLIDRDRVAGARVHSAALRNRDAAVNADQFAGPVEERSAGIARIDRRVDLQAVGVFQNRIGRVLVAVDAAHDAEGRRRLKIRGEQKRVSEHIDPVARRGRHRCRPTWQIGKSSRPKSLINATSPVGSTPTSTAS